MESDFAYVRPVVISTVTMNTFDLIMTVTLLSTGLVYEANPFMRAFIEAGGIPAFAVMKMSMVTLGIAYLWSIRKILLARVGLVLSMLCYAYVTSVHLSIVAEHGLRVPSY